MYQNYLWAWEYKRFEIPVNVTKVFVLVFLNSVSDLSPNPCPPHRKSSNPARQLHLGPWCAFTVSFCLPVLLLLVKLEHPSFFLLEYREIALPLCYPCSIVTLIKAHGVRKVCRILLWFEWMREEKGKNIPFLLW